MLIVNSGRSGDCDGFETSAIRNLEMGNRIGAKARGIEIYESHLGAIWMGAKIPEINAF